MDLRNRRRLGASVGAWIIALGSTVTANVPAPAGQDDGSITLTGCLLLGPYGDYILSKTIVAASSVTNSVAWKLEGQKQLLTNVLENVEVTGTMLPMPDVPHAVGTTGSDRPTRREHATEYRLRIKTIKKLGDCLALPPD